MFQNHSFGHEPGFIRSGPKIILLLWIYNNPEKLEYTIKSLLESDIDICVKRYIYYDCSDDIAENTILNNPHYMNIENKCFTVIRGITTQSDTLKNKSYIDALNYIKYNDSGDFILTVENGVYVQTDFVNVIYSEYARLFSKYNTFCLLFIGFGANTFTRICRKTEFILFFHHYLIDYIVTRHSFLDEILCTT